MFGKRKKQRDQIDKIGKEAARKIQEIKEEYDARLKACELENQDLKQTVRNYDELTEMNKEADYIDPVTGTTQVRDEMRKRVQYRENIKDTGMPF